MGGHTTTGFPIQYVNQPVAYHPQQAVQMPPEEEGGMSRLHDHISKMPNLLGAT